MTDFTLETLVLDLPAVAASFGRRLRDAGLPVGPGREAAFVSALRAARPVSRRRLYWVARAVFVSDRLQVPAFDVVFRSVFGVAPAASPGAQAADEALPALQPGPADERAPSDEAQHAEAGAGVPALLTAPSTSPADDLPEQPLALSPSDEEVLRERRFDELSPEELRALHGVMSALRLTAPRRRTRRRKRSHHGTRIDLRGTLRTSLRTGGDPVRLRRRRRRIVPRRLVFLCDISGSMEPYARAYLQFLACVSDVGAPVEAFLFATRLTRVTRALSGGTPGRAMARASQAAPDWSSGTRIGEALRTFNDRHGRRGMARGAIVVILSDGWERGDPALVGREMARLNRLAHRIVWVNPRAASASFVPRAGGMAAALPYCHALVSGHSLAALEEVVAAIAGGDDASPPVREPGAEPEEPWGSATPVPGSSVAMPSGYGPSRGRTTPGWSIGQ